MPVHTVCSLLFWGKWGLPFESYDVSLFVLLIAIFNWWITFKILLIGCHLLSLENLCLTKDDIGASNPDFTDNMNVNASDFSFTGKYFVPS